MTVKINEKVLQGAWFERDVSWLSVTSVGSFANAEWTVGAGPTYVRGKVAKAVNVLETRGTILALSKVSDDEISVVIGHAGGQFSAAVITELQNALIAAGLAGSVVVLGTMFTVS